MLRLRGQPSLGAVTQPRPTTTAGERSWALFGNQGPGSLWGGSWPRDLL